MTPTPETNQALSLILDEHGELCEDSAPFILVRLCKKLERKLKASKELIESLEDALIEIEACCYEDDSENAAADASWHVARKAIRKLKEHNRTL
jgi:hypothetical protein